MTAAADTEIRAAALRLAARHTERNCWCGEQRLYAAPLAACRLAARPRLHCLPRLPPFVAIGGAHVLLRGFHTVKELGLGTCDPDGDPLQRLCRNRCEGRAMDRQK